MRAWFDADGFLLFALAGDMDVVSPPGSVTASVSDEADVNALFLDDGHVVERHGVEISADRTFVAWDEGQSATFGDLPDPAWVSVNGARERITGGVFQYTSLGAETVKVELVGPHTSNAVLLTIASAADLLDLVRAERDRRLAASDWTQMTDNNLTIEQRGVWADYRAALRQLPTEQPVATLETVLWPQEP